MAIKVTKLEARPGIDANWDKPPWRRISPERVGNYMGEKPGHFPKTQVKMAYDDAALYVIFRVEDRYVRAVGAHYQDSVCRDSCVEFFFTPASDASRCYFNLEVNCGGTALFHFQEAPGTGRVEIPEDRFGTIEIAHSLPAIIDPEITEATTWTVEYRLPVDLLEAYCPLTRPTPGVNWRANFYKCGDATSHPHWLTWAPVDFPRPNFHLPEFFGVLEFA